MQGNFFTIGIEMDATLTGDIVRRFSLPVGATLIGANAGCDNATSFILDVGTAVDDDAYIDGETITGAAATTTDIAASDLVGGAPMHILAGTEVVITIDYDGGARGDAAGIHVDLFLREG
ncbi:MAG: hypothetical protein ACK2T4_06760 [Candidatus Promineifilaceae bacterium]|jgi:hypothetical protein